MYNNKKISCIIPCRNEERGIEAILKKKPSFIDEVIVVDNGSKDRTADIARKLGAIVIYEEKIGYGSAYLAGFSKVSGDVIIMLDGDDTYPITDSARFINHMENEGYDFITGCRFPLVNKNNMPIVKRGSNILISLLTRKLFNINLIDSQSGMFIFKRSLLKSILPTNLDMSFGYAFKLRAHLQLDIKCGELYIAYARRLGKIKYRAIKDGLCTVFCMLYYLWVNRYFKKASPALKRGYGGEISNRSI